VLALLDAVGPEGTLVMPTHSGDLTDPAGWVNPPVPKSWWAAMRDQMPAYDQALTPTRGMGVIADAFRHLPGGIRSTHPTVSAAAFGSMAASIVSHHELDHGLGEASP
jgi:aminoglycoside 3-N-acetyltransferase